MGAGAVEQPGSPANLEAPMPAAPAYVTAAAGSHRRRDIQGLRAVAVALVIACHAQVPGFAGGYIGVDVFFVISGYVITQLLLRQPRAPLHLLLADFYRRRILRLLPASTLVLVATLLASWWILGNDFDPRLTLDTRWAVLFAENFRLMTTHADYFLAGVDPSLVTHYWSLAVEEQFYLCYPVLVFAAVSLARRWAARRVLAVILCAGVAASAVWSAYATAVNPIDSYYSPFTRFWELGLGGLVALAGASALPRRAGQVLSAAGVAALVASLALFDSSSRVPGVMAWLPCAGAAALLFAGSSRDALTTSAVLGVKPMTWLGDISYSLYLWHFGWLVLPTQMESTPLGASWAFAGVLGTLACAWLSYRFVESPIRHSRRLQRDSIAVAAIAIACGLAVWDLAQYIDLQLVSR